MDDLTTDVAGMTLDPIAAEAEARVRIQEAFNAITAYAMALRRGSGSISAEEIAGTAALAAPFAPGGLVVLLLEPLANHPWRKGVRKVIGSCPTLDSLDEGVEIASDGNLLLVENVSVLDLRPYVCTGVMDRLSDTQLNKLYELVFAFIDAKRPDVILAMGKEARKEVRHRMSTLPVTTKVVEAYHPSYAVNWNSTSSSKRKKLLESISEAVVHLHPELNEHASPALDLLHNIHAATTTSRESIYEEDQSVFGLLYVLARLCIPPDIPLPPLNLNPDNDEGYFLFEEWPWSIASLDPVDPRGYTVRKKLAPLLLELSEHVTPASWFLRGYWVQWEGVHEVVAEAKSSLHALNILLNVQGYGSSLLKESSGMKQPAKDISDDIRDLIARLKVHLRHE